MLVLKHLYKMLVLVLLSTKNFSGMLLVLVLDQFTCIWCSCLCLSIFRCACPIPDVHAHVHVHVYLTNTATVYINHR